MVVAVVLTLKVERDVSTSSGGRPAPHQGFRPAEDKYYPKLPVSLIDAPTRTRKSLFIVPYNP